jgi:hypothetical protein
MIVKLDKILGIPTAKGWDSEILHDVMAGVIAAPALAIPLLGAGVASAYIKSIGENYSHAVIEVLKTSSALEQKDNSFISRRIKEELHKRHVKQRERRSIRTEANHIK